MRAYFFASVLCVAMCLHCATAHWPKWELKKGKTCEDHCKQKIKMCDPVAEFNDCKCFPQKIMTHWLKHNSLPIDPVAMCAHLRNLSMDPKCCDYYHTENDLDVKNILLAMGSRIESQSQEMEQLGEQNKNMVSKIESQSQEMEQLGEQNKNMVSKIESQSQEMEQLGEQNKNMVSKIESQSQEMEQQNKEMTSKIESQSQEMEQLGEQNKKMVSKIESQSQEIEQLDEQNKGMASKIESQSQEMEQLKKSHSNEVELIKEFLSHLTADMSTLDEQASEIEQLEKSVESGNVDRLRLSKTLGEQTQELSSLRQTLDKQPWKVPVETRCPDKWRQRGRSCYFHYTNVKLDWYDAASFCTSHNGYLATIEDSSENAFVKTLLSVSTGSVWIGASDIDYEGRWRWTETNNALHYTSWCVGEPNNGEHAQDCLQMMHHSIYGWVWDDDQCSDKMNFVCEKTLLG